MYYKKLPRDIKNLAKNARLCDINKCDIDELLEPPPPQVTGLTMKMRNENRILIKYIL